MRTYLITTVLFGGLTLLVVGCTDHYRVTDPMSGKSYYTTKVDNAGRGGAVKTKDEKSGSIVTLQSSEVKTISEEEYEAAMVANAPMSARSRSICRSINARLSASWLSVVPIGTG